MVRRLRYYCVTDMRLLFEGEAESNIFKKKTVCHFDEIKVLGWCGFKMPIKSRGFGEKLSIGVWNFTPVRITVSIKVFQYARYARHYLKVTRSFAPGSLMKRLMQKANWTKTRSDVVENELLWNLIKIPKKRERRNPTEDRFEPNVCFACIFFLYFRILPDLPAQLLKRNALLSVQNFNNALSTRMAAPRPSRPTKLSIRRNVLSPGARTATLRNAIISVDPLRLPRITVNAEIK